MTTLDELKKISKKIKKCNIFDIFIDSFLYQYSIVEDGKYNTKIFISNEIYKIEVQGFNNSILFAVNAPEKVSMINKMISKQPRELPLIFLPRFQTETPLLKWIFDKNNSELINLLNISENNALFVYKNAIILYIDSAYNILNKIKILYEIVESLSKGNLGIKYSEINSKNIPVNLKSLIPFIHKWATSNDILREEKIQHMSKEEKKELVEKVYPLLGEIDNYISKYKEPLPEEALLFGDLAQITLEIINQ